MSILTHSALLAQQPSNAAASQSSKLQPASQPAGFLFRTLQIGNESYNYSIYVPPEYTPDRAWPAILFLHGSGERGNDGLLQTEVGIATAIRRNRAICPAIVIMPQCREGQAWIGPMAEMALQCLEQTVHAYRVDTHRIYLTGLSLGGYGAWFIAERAPHLFAAVVPVCGFYEQHSQPCEPQKLQNLAQAIKALPIWTFHGTKDPAVSVKCTQAIVQALQAAGSNVKFTEYPDGLHDVWNRAYADPELWRWMLAQRRSAAPASQPGK